MKVLNVYKTYFPDPPGGIQEAIKNISAALLTFRIKSLVYALSKQPKPDYIQRSEADVHRAKAFADPASCELGWVQAFKLFSRLTKEVDIVQYHYPWPFQDILHCVLRPEVPTVLCYHSDIVRQKYLGKLYERLMWSTLKSVGCIVATSPQYAKTSPVLSDRRICHKVKVIPLGIDEASYSFAEDNEIFNQLKIDKNEPYFLFVGVFRYYKGLKYLIEAAKQVSAKIVLAGSGFELENIKKYAQTLECENVLFAGQVTHAEKVSLIKNCYTFVLPSHLRSEAFGVVLIEASMMQKPMISCEIGTGTSFVNENKVTGLVVAPADSHALANAMNQLLNDKETVKKMGVFARKRYETFFSGEALGREYSNLYEQLLRDKM